MLDPVFTRSAYTHTFAPIPQFRKGVGVKKRSSPCPLGRLRYTLNQAAAALALTLGPARSAEQSSEWLSAAAEGLPGAF